MLWKMSHYGGLECPNRTRVTPLNKTRDSSLHVFSRFRR